MRVDFTSLSDLSSKDRTHSDNTFEGTGVLGGGDESVRSVGFY